MYKNRIAFLFTLFLILVACRKEEPLPTVIPTAILPTSVPVDNATPTPSESGVETAAPEPVRIDPSDIDWSPQVIYSSPSPGEETLLDGAITVRFDQPMDQASVESAFAVTVAEGERAVSGTFNWPRSDTVVFTPQASLRRQTMYRVQIGETAASANGIALDVPVELALQTVGSLEVSQVIPDDGTVDVQTDGAITVLFNRPVVPLVSSGRQADLPMPFTLTPPVAGQGEWTSTSIYRFVPDEPLAGATTYQVTIDPNLTDITGVTLAQPYSWRFTTLNPEIVVVEPDGLTPIAPTTPISITFNMPMDRSSTEAAISLRGIAAPVPSLDFQWADNDRIVGIRPQRPLTLETEYQLQVDASARSASGEASLVGQGLFVLTTHPFPRVASVRPSSGSVAERWQRGVSIQFASPMDWSTIEDRIRIDPAPEFVDYFINAFSNEVTLDFALELDTSYTVTVPGFAADPYGNTLGEPFTWRFNTPGREPIASFNLPSQISQLSTSFVTEVDVIHVNVSALNVALYDLGLPLNLINRPFDLQDYRPAANPFRTWEIPLETAANEVGVLSLSLAQGGTLPTGVYFLTLDTPETTEQVRFWQNQRQALIVADTNIVVKEMFGAVHVWVTELASGEPAAGRDLTLYSDQGVQIGTAVSDNNGFARFDYRPANDFLSGVTVVSNRPGEAGFGIGSSVWSQGISPFEFGINATTGDEEEVFAYIYTDRPIYRPGDTMYFKGIVRQPNYGRYAIPAPRTFDLTLSFFSFFGEEGLEVTFPVEANADGSFAGEYTLPDEASLGRYQLFIQEQGVNAFREFTVAEYRQPEFLVSMTPAQAEALRGQSVAVTLEASYFFGGPAADLQVDWSIYEEPYHLDVPGPFYNFGDNGSFFYEDPGFFGGPGSGRNWLLSGSGQTDGNGRLIINVPADVLGDVAAGSRTIVVEANVIDLSNFPVTSRTQVIFHAAETYVGVKPTNYLSAAGTTTEVDVKTVDWDGQAAANQDVEVVFYRRQWRPIRSQDFGLYYTRWEAIDTEVARTQVVTDGQGQARVSFVPETGGTYLAVATVTDSGGRSHLSSTTLWVTGIGGIGWQTDPRQKRMDLVPDLQTYRPGDTARVLVQSPFDGPVRAWLTIERGTLIEQRLITLNSNSDVLAIPITADFAPNVFVTVTAVKGVDANDADPYPDLRIGMTELTVSPEQLALDVRLTPQDTSFAPRETAVYDIEVTDHEGNPVAAELSLALVDLSVLTLKEDNAPPILEAFYAPQPYRSQVGSGLIISGEGLPLDIPVEVFGLGGGGGDFAAETALARTAGEEDEDVRRDFPDTAFWEASVTTNSNGQATVEIPLPDSLTTWRLSSKAVTTDSLVGQTSVDIVTTLPLLVRPVTPRFFTVGDVIQIGAIVNNNTGQALETAVTLEADGLILAGEATQTVTVAANAQELVRWEVSAGNVSFADLTFRVSGGEYSDATKPTFGQGPDNLIPIYQFTAADIVATAGTLDDAGRQVEAILLPAGVDTSQGSVDITLSPSLAAAVVETLKVNNRLDYLPVCAHAVTSRLLPNVAVRTLIQQLDSFAIDTGLQQEVEQIIAVSVAQLDDLVNLDGGWGWCGQPESDPWLTAYTLFALAKARQVGTVVDSNLINNAATYLAGSLQSPATLTQAYEVNQQAFYLYVLAELDVAVTADLDALIAEHRTLLNPAARAMMILAYEGGESQIQTLLADLNDAVVLSATGAHWEDERGGFRSLHSDIQGTAVAIQALSHLQPDHVLLPPAVRWLMAARQAALWSTPSETAWSLLALTEWMAATGELDADYDYGLRVNLQPVAEGRFTTENINEGRAVSVPLSSLPLDDPSFFDFQRGGGDGRLYYTMHLNSFIDMSQVDPVSRGITVDRTYYDANCDPIEEDCQPINQITAGQQVRVVLTIIAANDLLYATIEDPIPAGTEALDPGLATTGAGVGGSRERVDEDYVRGYWGWWFFDRIEYRDERVVFLSQFLPAGTYQYTYFLQATIPGRYQVRPTFANEEFFPEVNGRSDGMIFVIAE